ncbi:Fcf2 pre-rRNA processing-domain-containing protein [Cercophora scortea]|uniref:Fcf2 pre-rRNA processing-domain-containing protein n=1 Tax=Cercophora scortea TaxID=314031 RepID=A0AAE0MII7_9PEZI|nr:Fcf2 pre-rRNA processing-domain-containing protein [Cercophora scortea]
MAISLGLSETEIDRLLAEAEARLASNGVNAGVVAVAPATTKEKKTLAIAPSSELVAALKKDTKAVTIRVPEPTHKTKATKDNAGPDWFNMPRTNLTPELKRDLQLLKMRDVVAMGKQFFKKDGRKAYVPEFAAVGTIIAGATDGRNSRLTRKERKRTIVEEVLAGEKLDKYKSKYHEIQEKSSSGRKAHYKNVIAKRRRNG